ncbi:MAG: pyridoxal phosphate-dependent aminotransferase [Paracoccaceae bacterium]
MTKIRFTPLLDDLPATVPFVGPETQERQRGAEFAARLGANENIFGPSPKAIRAMQEATSEIWKYGDPTSFDLRNALADHLGLAVENIVVGEGIDGLLGYLARMIVQQGDPVVTSDGAYPTFNYHIVGYGGVLHKVPYREDHEDLEGLLACVEHTGARLVYLANPDNPMGTIHDAQAIEAFIERLPKTCLLALDEAYIEFAPDGIAPNSKLLFDNVIRFRTFSKGYGMAGARVGYAFGPVALISQFEKIRNHFGMNRVAQIGAIAALSDQQWVSHLRDEVSEARARIGEIAAQNGLSIIASATNFVSIDCGRDGGFAKAVLANLVREGIFVRMPFVAPQDRCIRVSAGPKADLDLFAKILPKALDAARLEN